MSKIDSFVEESSRTLILSLHFCGAGQFSFDRTLLRIPVTYRYRLLCHWYADRIIPLRALSHEAYNAVARNKKRLKGS